MSRAFDMLAYADIARVAENGRRSGPHAGLIELHLRPRISRHIAEARAHWWSPDDASKTGPIAFAASEAHEVLRILQVLRGLSEFFVAVRERIAGRHCYQYCAVKLAPLPDGGLIARRPMLSIDRRRERVFRSMGARLRVVGSR